MIKLNGTTLRRYPHKHCMTDCILQESQQKKKFWLLECKKTAGTNSGTKRNSCCTLKKGMWAMFHNADRSSNTSTTARPLPRLQFSSYALGAFLTVLLLSLNRLLKASCLATLFYPHTTNAPLGQSTTLLLCKKSLVFGLGLSLKI